jgi:hypothetical protein
VIYGAVLLQAGRYGATNGLTTSSCSGECLRGYYCPIGSKSSQQKSCPLHATSPMGSSSFLNCSCIDGYSSTVFNDECISIGIRSGSLQVVNGEFNVSNDGSLVLPMNDNNMVSFGVTGNWELAIDQITPASDTIMFTFGPSSSSQRYRCAALTRQQINDTFSTMECGLPFLYTQKLSFHIWFKSINGSLLHLNSPSVSTHDTFSYPLPSFTSGTLRPSSLPSSSGKQEVIASTNYLSESLSFDGQRFVNDPSLLSIYYGPVTNINQFQCEMDVTKTTLTTLTCHTEASSLSGTIVLYHNS